jgi:hypothetical protein
MTTCCGLSLLKICSQSEELSELVGVKGVFKIYFSTAAKGPDDNPTGLAVETLTKH